MDLAYATVFPTTPRPPPPYLCSGVKPPPGTKDLSHWTPVNPWGLPAILSPVGGGPPPYLCAGVKPPPGMKDLSHWTPVSGWGLPAILSVVAVAAAVAGAGDRGLQIPAPGAAALPGGTPSPIGAIGAMERLPPPTMGAWSGWYVSWYGGGDWQGLRYVLRITSVTEWVQKHWAPPVILPPGPPGAPPPPPPPRPGGSHAHDGGCPCVGSIQLQTKLLNRGCSSLLNLKF